MKFFNKAKMQYRRKRLWKAIRVQCRWSLRRIRHAFQREQIGLRLRGRYARRMYAMVGLILGIFALAIASSLLRASYLADEAVLVRRLSAKPDRAEPVLAALDCFGATNRLQVTVQTETYHNLRSKERVDLDRGNVNLVLTLKDGSYLEYTLQNRNIDNFESGSTDQFTLILPSSISPFDIADYKLSLLPDAKGQYGSWHCKWAKVSFLLGGERMLLAADDWDSAMVFSKESTGASLILNSSNAYLNQVRELYPFVLAVCQNKKETVHEKAMKYEALEALGISGGDTLYLDIETLSIENQNALISKLVKKGLIGDRELMDYDGTMKLRLRFYAAHEGSYYKDYNLDTLGKDDFELGASSTFEMTMPEGLSIFDIRSAELLVEDEQDAWAPRMLRLYTKTDYGTLLELARFTDTTLRATRGTEVFAKGLIDTHIDPLSFDLTAEYVQPKALKEEIESKFGMKLDDVAYSMYFSKFDFYDRQKLFYHQLEMIYGENSDEKSA